LRASVAWSQYEQLGSKELELVDLHSTRYLVVILMSEELVVCEVLR